MFHISILPETDRAAIRQSLLASGARSCNQGKLAAYLAEVYAEKGYSAKAYGQLLKAARLGIAVPADLLETFAKQVRETPRAELASDYEANLVIGCEVTDFAGKIFFLKLAANSPQDKFGVAALKLADQLTSNLQYKTQSEYYYALAASKGNPDILPCLSGRQEGRK